jgi:hypothetical protein
MNCLTSFLLFHFTSFILTSCYQEEVRFVDNRIPIPRVYWILRSAIGSYKGWLFLLDNITSFHSVEMISKFSSSSSKWARVIVDLEQVGKCSRHFIANLRSWQVPLQRTSEPKSISISIAICYLKNSLPKCQWKEKFNNLRGLADKYSGGFNMSNS